MTKKGSLSDTLDDCLKKEKERGGNIGKRGLIKKEISMFLSRFGDFIRDLYDNSSSYPATTQEKESTWIMTKVHAEISYESLFMGRFLNIAVNNCEEKETGLFQEAKYHFTHFNYNLPRDQFQKRYDPESTLIEILNYCEGHPLILHQLNLESLIDNAFAGERYIPIKAYIDESMGEVVFVFRTIVEEKK